MYLEQTNAACNFLLDLVLASIDQDKIRVFFKLLTFKFGDPEA